MKQLVTNSCSDDTTVGLHIEPMCAQLKVESLGNENEHSTVPYQS